MQTSISHGARPTSLVSEQSDGRPKDRARQRLLSTELRRQRRDAPEVLERPTTRQIGFALEVDGGGLRAVISVEMQHHAHSPSFAALSSRGFTRGGALPN